MIPTPTGGQPQGITAARIGRPVDTPTANGEIGPVPLTSALPPGETGISTITALTTTPIPLSIISGYVVPFVMSLYTYDDCMSGVRQIDLLRSHLPGHGDDDDDRFKRPSSFTTTTEVVSYSLTEISGTQTSIPITKTATKVLPTLVPVHSHSPPNRSATPHSGLAQLDESMPLTIRF